jgi:hypothetical protein
VTRAARVVATAVIAGPTVVVGMIVRAVNLDRAMVVEMIVRAVILVPETVVLETVVLETVVLETVLLETVVLETVLLEAVLLETAHVMTGHAAEIAMHARLAPREISVAIGIDHAATPIDLLGDLRPTAIAELARIVLNATSTRADSELTT